MPQSNLHYLTFVLLLIVVTVAFGWLLWPFYGAVFWGSILAIIFAPLHRRLVQRMPGRPNLAALISLSLVLLMVIIPVIGVTGSLMQEGASLFQRVKSGHFDVGQYFQQIMAALPAPIQDILARFDSADVPSLQKNLSNAVIQGSQFLATRAFSIGQDTFQFVISFGVMLYLLFFLFRDGPDLSRRLRSAFPLSEEHKKHLFLKFTTVIRATVKGNIAVAAVQGALGGLIFAILGIQGALLWAVIMGFLSLLPAIGAGLIWGPVAIYFLVTGSVWQGVTLILYGVLVIGMVDNVLRPLLVGKDIKLPDYLVLISMLGGMAFFGLNGFVIGPLIAALFMSCWDLFSPEVKETGKSQIAEKP